MHIVSFYNDTINSTINRTRNSGVTGKLIVRANASFSTLVIS